MKYEIGRRVEVDIIKGGYWTGFKRGEFLGFTKTGRARVKLNHGDVVRVYKTENVKFLERLSS